MTGLDKLRNAVRRLVGAVRRGGLEQRLDEEMRFHVEMLTERNLQRGMSAEEAHRAALAAFGGRERFKDDARDEYRNPVVDELARDLRLALRSLRRAPAFAVTAMLTLALGIGATTAIFSVLNALLLRDLPYPEADRLVRIYSRATDGTAERGPLSAGDYTDLGARQSGFVALAPFRLGTPIRSLTGQGDPESVSSGEVGVSMFSVLRTSAQLGRTFTAGDEAATAVPTVVLGDDLWRRVFGADSAVLGRPIVLDDTSRIVIGVLPPGAGVPGVNADLWLPLRLDPVLRDPARVRRRGWLGAIGRLHTGTTLDQAQDEVARIGRALAVEHPDANDGRGLTAISQREALVGELRPTVLALFAASGLVLLIACANLAGAFLARLITRSRDLAIRSALGAGRGRIVRQVLAETLLLSAAGGVLGVFLANVGAGALRAAFADTAAWAAGASIDGWVLAFATAISLGAALLFGVGPALIIARADPHHTLQAGGRGSPGGGRLLARRVLLVTQFALAVTLSIGAGLMVKSLEALYRVALGFEPSGVLSFQVAPSGERYASLEQHVRFLDALSDRLLEVGGVAEAAVASSVPLTSHDLAGVVVEGRAATRQGIEFVGITVVSGDYFSALRVPLLRGRTFGPGDGPDAPPVVIVSRGMAEQYWPGVDPVGRRVRLGPDTAAPWKEVIGIVADVRQDGVAEEPQPLAYLAASQNHISPMTVIVRTTVDPLAVARGAREALRSVDPLLPAFDVQSMNDIVNADLADRRLLGFLLSLFASLALVLAAVGVYGVSAHEVSARTREYAVRVALGSTGAGVLALVLRQGLGMAFVGIAVGLAGVAALTPLLRSFLFPTAAVHPTVATGAALALLVVSLLGALPPARRASRVAPMLILRED